VARAAKDIQGDLYYSEEGGAHYLLEVKYAVALAEALKEVDGLSGECDVPLDNE
jgi:hypothetical protein